MLSAFATIALGFTLAAAPAPTHTAPARAAADDVLPMTAENVDRLLKGYAAASAVRQQMDARFDKFQQCMTDLAEDEQYEKLLKVQEAAYSKSNDESEAAGKAVKAFEEKKCGKDPSYSDAEYAEDDMAGAKAAGLTPRQYNILRERAVAFVMLARKERTDNYRQYRFNAEESKVLAAKRAEIERVMRSEW